MIISFNSWKLIEFMSIWENVCKVIVSSEEFFERVGVPNSLINLFNIGELSLLTEFLAFLLEEVLVKVGLLIRFCGRTVVVLNDSLTCTRYSIDNFFLDTNSVEDVPTIEYSKCLISNC